MWLSFTALAGEESYIYYSLVKQERCTPKHIPKTCLSYYHNNDNVLCGECEQFWLQENIIVTSSSVMVKKTKKMVHKLISECALNINTLITSDSTTFQYESPQRW